MCPAAYKSLVTTYTLIYIQTVIIPPSVCDLEKVR